MNENARAALDFMSAELGSTYLTPDSVKPVLDSSRTGGSGELSVSVSWESIGTSLPKIIPMFPEPESMTMAMALSMRRFWTALMVIIHREISVDSPSRIPLIVKRVILFVLMKISECFPVILFILSVPSRTRISYCRNFYGLDPSARLIRRTKTLNLDGSSNQLERLVTFGQFIDPATKKFVVPQPVPLGGHTRAGTVRQAMTNWDTESAILRRNNDPDQNTYQVLAYDIRGLRFRYWYYDYNRGGWRFAKEWDSARETALMRANEVLFNQPAQNNSIEGRTRFGFENIIVNEPADMYPRAAGPGMNFTVRDPGQILSNPEMQQVRNRISQETDGLPTMVEIVIYVQDRTEI